MTRNELATELGALLGDGYEATDRRRVTAWIEDNAHVNGKPLLLPLGGEHGWAIVSHERLDRPHYQEARDWAIERVPPGGDHWAAYDAATQRTAA